MLSKTYGGAVYGVNASMITIEVTVSQGVKFFMVGLPDSAVKESEQRMEASHIWKSDGVGKPATQR